MAASKAERRAKTKRRITELGRILCAVVLLATSAAAQPATTFR
jgi:hypothetical protein